MFKVQPDPTFKAEIPVKAQGKTQTLKITFRHMRRSDYMDMLDGMAKEEISASDVLLRIVDSWNADVKVDAEGVAELLDAKPGIEGLIVMAYGRELAVAREGN